MIALREAFVGKEGDVVPVPESLPYPDQIDNGIDPCEEKAVERSDVGLGGERQVGLDLLFHHVDVFHAAL